MSRIGHVSILIGVVAALFAPAAVAERPDDRAGMLGVGGIVPAGSTRPDDHAGVRGPGAHAPVTAASTAAARPDDRAGVRGPGAAPRVILTQADGFDWADAGIGAVGAFGLALALFGALQVASRTRRSHAAA